MKKKWFTITDRELADDWNKKGLNLVTGFLTTDRPDWAYEEMKYSMPSLTLKTTDNYKE